MASDFNANNGDDVIRPIVSGGGRGTVSLEASLACVLDRMGELVRDKERRRVFPDLLKMFEQHAKASSTDAKTLIAQTIFKLLVGDVPNTLEPARLDSPLRPSPEYIKWKRYIAERIGRELTLRKWTQNELAARAQIPASHLSRILNQHHSPSRRTLVKLATALGIDPGQLDPSLSE